MFRGGLDRRVTALEQQRGGELQQRVIAVVRLADGSLSDKDQAALDAARPWDHVIEILRRQEGVST